MTDFLGGVKLGSAAERNEIAMRRELETRRALWGRDTLYRGAGDLLLRHGRFYAGRVTPDAYRQLVGDKSGCFTNALEAAEADPSLTYCEGVYTTGSGHCTPHAWVIDPNGELVEVTLPTWKITEHVHREPHSGKVLPYLPVDRWGYWGATFNTAYVRAHFEQFDLPMLDRPSADKMWENISHLDVTEDRDKWPVLEQPWSMSRTEP